MERVQFQQEQMLFELKDLVDKNIFTETETKQIMKKRTAFETTLVRRVAKKADFLRYITYEMSLEQLRRKRIARLDLPPAPPTVSDYALVRRQFHIFERALKRFRSDVGLWIQYIQLAKREGARALVGRITARALQLHPNKPALYIMAASHELDHLSPSAARTLLQRGIRMNPDSIDMWREYVRMELGFIESLRRRWDVLGISLITEGKVEKGKGKAEGEFDPNESAAARGQIMQGAIVKSVISSAAEALPQIGLFVQLKTVITEYPSPAELRTQLFEHLYDLVRSTLPGDAEAVRLLADRHIKPGLRGTALVDAVQRANEKMLAEVRSRGQEEIYRVYADFVEDWCQRTVDQHMKQYLILSLQGVIQQIQTSASLFSTHIRLLTSVARTDANVPAKVLRLGQKYTAKAPASSQVWLARLAAEKEFGTSGAKGQASVVETWRSARQYVAGKEEDVLNVWIWGLGDEEAKLVGDKRKTHEALLKESMGSGSLRGVHEKLLMSYVTTVHEAMGQEEISDQASQVSGKWLHEVHRIGRSYLTNSKVWQKVFSVVKEAGWEEGKYEVLGAVYSRWRAHDAEMAGVTWCRWLASHGRGAEAGAVAAGLAGRGQEDWREWMDVTSDA
ncbi:U3 small nucleolar RNA-associated protein 6 [Leucoagaricus sp. SymC.cos]|nr:U3 small nucleolar RNA-associated protein 6 [Leucoagaricus sp. SymC.cos]